MRKIGLSLCSLRMRITSDPCNKYEQDHNFLYFKCFRINIPQTRKGIECWCHYRDLYLNTSWLSSSHFNGENFNTLLKLKMLFAFQKGCPWKPFLNHWMAGMIIAHYLEWDSKFRNFAASHLKWKKWAVIIAYHCVRISFLLSKYFPLIFPTDTVLICQFRPTPRLDALRAAV